VALLVFLLSGQGQNRLFKSHFVLPSPSRTCVADDDVPLGTVTTATAPLWVASPRLCRQGQSRPLAATYSLTSSLTFSLSRTTPASPFPFLYTHLLICLAIFILLLYVAVIGGDVYDY
jgi:hypothetical protein